MLGQTIGGMIADGLSIKPKVDPKLKAEFDRHLGAAADSLIAPSQLNENGELETPTPGKILWNKGEQLKGQISQEVNDFLEFLGTLPTETANALVRTTTALQGRS